MEQGTRLYVNITNHCNTDCPFCCMYSGTGKNTHMDFDTFKGIIDGCGGEFELQLEGGEPLLSDKLYLFLEYAISTGRCRKLLILSNGLEVDRHLERLVGIAQFYRITMELKVSINYWLIQQDKDFLDKMDRLQFSTMDLDYFRVVFNVRKRRTGDEGLEDLLAGYGLLEHANVYYFQAYGKLSGSGYDMPVIVQNIEGWRIYASDGTCFGQDLIARSEHEKNLR